MAEWTFTVGRPKANKSAVQNQLWEVTQVGENKINNYAGPDNPAIKVMASVASIGPANVEDISKDCGLGKDVVILHLRNLSAVKPPFVRLMPVKG
uniref:Uncharacterized protein n=1 Tax=viral metagenome TaxID=1070528 RepID=A0A6M3L708_9ZZZZ